METSASPDKPQAQLPLGVAGKRAAALYAQGRYEESLNIYLQITNAYPEIAAAWRYLAANCFQLGRWQDAIRYTQTAFARSGDTLTLYILLAYGYSALKQWSEVRHYGLQALNMYDRLFDGKPAIPWPESKPMPPLPSAQTRERNIIAFSLFGHDSKYCETAVLNVQEQPKLYPHWICRFYVDGSVPESVINRIRAGGGQIVPVEGPAAQWPGPMWRFLALDDPLAHRILFRDADSVISQREAAAVEQWLTSGKRFHMMRDDGSHTELMMAGMWGVVGGSLPPLQKLMDRFMSAPLESTHFADQFFLRQYVWPYARSSLMQHDSVFGFMDAVAFPDKERPADFHVGFVESATSFSLKSNQPDGSIITWGLFRIIEKLDNGQVRAELVCSYPGTVQNGVVKAHIPRRYLRWIEQGTAFVNLLRNGAT